MQLQGGAPLCPAPQGSGSFRGFSLAWRGLDGFWKQQQSRSHRPASWLDACAWFWRSTYRHSAVWLFLFAGRTGHGGLPEVVRSSRLKDPSHPAHGEPGCQRHPARKCVLSVYRHVYTHTHTHTHTFFLHFVEVPSFCPPVMTQELEEL